MAMTEQDKFIQDYVRPIAEHLRAIGVFMREAKAEYLQLSTPIPNDTKVLDAGRVDQGVPGLKGTEITVFIQQIVAVLAVLDAEGAMDVIRKPCVRPLELR